MGREQRTQGGDGRNCRRAGRGGNSSNDKNRQENKPKSLTPKKETLKDHVFNFGSAKNASEFNTNVKFILNYIKRTYTEGKDIAKAMETGKEMDFDAIAPKIQPITADPKDSVAYETMKMQHAEDYKIDRLKHRD